MNQSHTFWSLLLKTIPFNLLIKLFFVIFTLRKVSPLFGHIKRLTAPINSKNWKLAIELYPLNLFQVIQLCVSLSKYTPLPWIYSKNKTIFWKRSEQVWCSFKYMYRGRSLNTESKFDGHLSTFIWKLTTKMSISNLDLLLTQLTKTKIKMSKPSRLTR